MSLKCQCKKINCILKNKRVFEEFRNKTLLEKQYAKCSCCEEQDSYTTKHSYVKNIFSPLEKTIYGKSTCFIAKEYMKLRYFLKELSDVNINYSTKFSEHDLLLDEISIENSKIKSILTKQIYINNEQKKEIQQLSTTVTDNTIERKKLKKQIKCLEKSISKMKFDDKQDSDSDESIEEVIVYKEIIEEVIVYKEIEEKKKKKKENNEIEIILKYQTLKNYMIFNNVSLSQICKRMNIEIPRMLRIFFTLKYIRNDIAHPNINNPITSDKDFIKFLQI
jgi:uncharacterized coiled-coil protein SlyX